MKYRKRGKCLVCGETLYNRHKYAKYCREHAGEASTNQRRERYMRYKSNKKIRIEKDSEKSYVYVYHDKKMIGILSWHYAKHKWVYEEMKNAKKTSSVDRRRRVQKGSKAHKKQTP